MEQKDKIVMIKITWGTREKLKRLGIKSETYDVIVKRLIKGWIEDEEDEEEEVEGGGQGGII